MAFMLGSFTSGLFGAVKDVMDIGNRWEQLKQERLETQQKQLDWEKGVAARKAVEADQGAQQAARDSAVSTAPAAPYGRGGENSPARSYTDKDLAAMPTPKYLQTQPALPGVDNSSPREGQAFGGAQASGGKQRVPVSQSSAIT